jgi:hypothetical protein
MSLFDVYIFFPFSTCNEDIVPTTRAWIIIFLWSVKKIECQKINKLRIVLNNNFFMPFDLGSVWQN